MHEVHKHITSSKTDLIKTLDAIVELIFELIHFTFIPILTIFLLTTAIQSGQDLDRSSTLPVAQTVVGAATKSLLELLVTTSSIESSINHDKAEVISEGQGCDQGSWGTWHVCLYHHGHQTLDNTCC